MCNAAVHLLGLTLTATIMRRGTIAVPFQERVVYLAEEPLAWTIGWLVWAVCALAFVALIFNLARRFPSRLAMVALALACAACIFDLLCDATWIQWAPHAARTGNFATVERWAFLGGLVLANGLYTISTLCMALALRSRVPVPVTLLGFVVVGFGVMLAVSGPLGSAGAVMIASGGVIGSFSAWGVVVAHTVR